MCKGASCLLSGRSSDSPNVARQRAWKDHRFLPRTWSVDLNLMSGDGLSSRLLFFFLYEPEAKWLSTKSGDEPDFWDHYIQSSLRNLHGVHLSAGKIAGMVKEAGQRTQVWLEQQQSSMPHTLALDEQDGSQRAKASRNVMDVHSGHVWASIPSIDIDGDRWTLVRLSVQEQGISQMGMGSSGGRAIGAGVEPGGRSSEPSTRCVASLPPDYPGSGSSATEDGDRPASCSDEAPARLCSDLVPDQSDPGHSAGGTGNREGSGDRGHCPPESDSGPGCACSTPQKYLRSAGLCDRLRPELSRGSGPSAESDGHHHMRGRIR